MPSRHGRHFLRAGGTRAQRQRHWFLAGAHLALAALAAAGFASVGNTSAHAREAAYAGRDLVAAEVLGTVTVDDVAPSTVVAYRSAAGLAYQAMVILGFETRPGDRVSVWVDGAGRPTTEPGPPDLLLRTVGACLAVGVTTLLALLATAYLSRRWSLRRDRRLFSAIVADIPDGLPSDRD